MAAILRVSKCPSRCFKVNGPLNAHSMGTCWSRSMPMSNAVPLVLSNLSAVGSPVMKSVLTISFPGSVAREAVGRLGVDSEIGDRLGDGGFRDSMSADECRERGDHHVLSIGLEEST